ncbi:MAG: hypothetical protein DRQ41_10685 [Gammaproteobacteria bacterium]|nr:MAG: hypothetical protein DRQ41_10685 [Gammaproteobacteria bacterium]
MLFYVTNLTLNILPLLLIEGDSNQMMSAASFLETSEIIYSRTCDTIPTFYRDNVMITTPLLEEIYDTQKRLDEEAQHDIEKYIENSQKMVLEIEKKYGLKFNYGQLEGRTLEPLPGRPCL